MSTIKLESRSRQSWIKGKLGFTLIEIIVAIALIAIGILGLSLNTIGIIKGNYISGNYSIATSLAQDKMEELLGQSGFTDVDNCTNPPDQDITATGGTGGIYDRCWIIADPSPSLGANLKQIDVTISWRDYLTRSVTLSTLVFAG